MPPSQLSAEDLHSIRVPCLILRGSGSHPTLRRIAGVLADGIPTAELVELAGAGHVTYAEQPEAFAQAVIQFGRRLGLLQPADPTEAVTRAA